VGRHVVVAGESSRVEEGRAARDAGGHLEPRWPVERGVVHVPVAVEHEQQAALGDVLVHHQLLVAAVVIRQRREQVRVARGSQPPHRRVERVPVGGVVHVTRALDYNRHAARHHRLVR
jgi:hypothetical protein